MVGGATTYDRYGFYYFSEGNFRVSAQFGGYIYGPAYATTAPVGALGFIGSGIQNGLPQAASDPVSAADAFIVNGPYFSNYYAYLDWSDGQTAFAGIRFSLNGGLDTHFGWAQITRVDSTHFTLHGFGYNDTPSAASHPTDTEEILTLEVNTVTGALTMLGDPNNAIVINSYEITSTGNSLDATNWFSLADQDFEGDYDGNGTIDGADFLQWQIDGGTPAQLAEWEAHYGNSGPGSGWEESGGIGTHVLAESFLLGDSTIAAAASISLGMGYDQSVDAQDLMFEYRTDTGAFVEGLVVYEAGIPGDFDGNGVVDGSDFLLWQRDPSVGSLADWKTNYGMGTALILAASAAVPEPSSILLLAAGAAGSGMWRRRRSNA